MTSSQAACANLFRPLHEDPLTAARVPGVVKTDLKSMGTGHTGRGSQIEFWNDPGHVLNDPAKVSGTGLDINLVIYNDPGNTNLWMIEYNWMDVVFCAWGGSKSQVHTPLHSRAPSAASLNNQNLCYFHSKTNFLC